MLITLTRFKDGQAPFDEEYEGNEGASMMALLDADEHVRNGGWCLLQIDNVAQMIERPVFNRSAPC